MNYSQLQALLQPSGGQLALKDSDFQGSGLEKLLQDFFDGQSLNLDAAVVTEIVTGQDKELEVKGLLTNSILNFTSLAGKIDLDAVFSIFDDQAHARIDLTFKENWPLPDVLKSQAFSRLNQDLNAGIANRLGFPLSKISLDSNFQSMLLVVDANLALDLSEIPQILQSTPVASSFPADFPSFDTGLELRSFGIASRVDPMVLTYLSMEVAQRKQQVWEPIGDLLKFKDFRLQFLLMNPLGGSFVQVDIETRVEVAGIDLVGAISLPSKRFQIYLQPGKTIDLKSVFDEILDIPVPIDKLTCTELAIIGDPELNTYQFSLTLGVNWEIIPNLILTGISADFIMITKPERSTGGSFTGHISFGTSDFFVSAENQPGATGWQFSGGIAPGTTLNVGDFVDTLADTFNVGGAAVDQVKDILGGITITQLITSFHTQTKDFHFDCMMEFSLDDTPADLLLSIDLTHTTDGHTIAFGGIFTLGVRQFSLAFTNTRGNSVSSTNMIAGFSNPDGEQIDIISGLVDLVSRSAPLQLPASAADLKLTTLILYKLELSYNKNPSGTGYGIKGDFGWEPSLSLNGDTIAPFKVRTQIALNKAGAAGSKVLGTICGDIESTIEGLDFIKFGLCYELKAANTANQLTLQLTIGKVTLNAVYSNLAGDVSLDFKADIKEKFTLGEIITFFASLVDPSIDEFEFDPPWNFLTDFDLAPILSSITLRLEIKRANKEKKFSIAFSNLNKLVPDSLSIFLTIKTLGLEYSSLTKKTNIILDANFLGKPQELKWDPINDAPPEIPGQGGAIFDLRYLGLGQRVAFTQASKVSSIKEVMDLLRGVIDENQLKSGADRSLKLRNPLELFGDGGPIAFSPESEWLIGLDVSLLKTLNLSVIFNDPVIYGLRIELHGQLAQNFAGLQFEILYQKISPTIGKYHVDLTLPDFVRHLKFGAVSVTLPIIVVDIFTNGDFKVDLGFPWNFNFARSFAIEVFPFTGAGGFYFNKLSAATATSTPSIPESKGVFTPVYEFGLGLRIGLGKTFNKGPLKAEISIVVQGMVEGVISWFNPANGNERELYYKISGGVAIVGRLYGEVDFGIISVSIEVIAKAMIQFVIEVYQPILIDLTAEVSVKASVKVAFIRIRFSFSLTVKQSFSIASPQDGPAPWLN